jgi:diphthamide biosynthesis protein 3
MSGIYEEVEIEDMTYDEETLTYYYPCPCGDKFSITLEDLLDEEVREVPVSSFF